MDLTCKGCSAQFRAAVVLPLAQPVRVECPLCRRQMVLRPVSSNPPVANPPAMPASAAPATPTPFRAPAASGRVAVIADEPRDFRNFLGNELGKLGFAVSFFDSGDAALEEVRRTRAQLVILNVYLKGKLGVEISEEIKKDESLTDTRVVLIGALFRANRFRANPTNLYGADEYIEEQIPAKELRELIGNLFPVSHVPEKQPEPKEYDEARRLARLILSDIVIYNTEKVDRGIRDGTFFEILKNEIDDGRHYYDSRISLRVRQSTEFFTETLQQFVQMKREELEKTDPRQA